MLHLHSLLLGPGGRLAAPASASHCPGTGECVVCAASLLIGRRTVPLYICDVLQGVAVSVAQTTTTAGGSLYPSLTDAYMGLELTRYVPPGAVVPASQSQAMVAPVSGAGNVGLKRAEIKQGESGVG